MWIKSHYSEFKVIPSQLTKKFSAWTWREITQEIYRYSVLSSLKVSICYHWKSNLTWLAKWILPPRKDRNFPPLFQNCGKVGGKLNVTAETHQCGSCLMLCSLHVYKMLAYQYWCSKWTRRGVKHWSFILIQKIHQSMQLWSSNACPVFPPPWIHSI